MYQTPKIFNPWNAKNRELNPSDAIPILKRYGWKGRINNFSLFAQACCHKSYIDRPDTWQEQAEMGEGDIVIAPRPDDCIPLQKCDNEELEYLGDRLPFALVLHLPLAIIAHILEFIISVLRVITHKIDKLMNRLPKPEVNPKWRQEQHERFMQEFNERFRNE